MTHPTAYMLEQTLCSITAATIKLDRDLGAIVRDAVAAREALAQGHAVAGSSLGAGPLGHQAPFDIAMTTARITALIEQALMLGANGSQITAAYKVAA